MFKLNQLRKIFWHACVNISVLVMLLLLTEKTIYGELLFEKINSKKLKQ